VGEGFETQVYVLTPAQVTKVYEVHTPADIQPTDVPAE
jgi:hypothetical protein